MNCLRRAEEKPSMSCLFLACSLLVADQPVDAVVVVPREFLPALQPLLDHRHRQGHRFAHIASGGSAENIRAAIRAAASGAALKYLLIVGDAEPSARVNQAVAARSVPTHLHKAVVNVKW